MFTKEVKIPSPEEIKANLPLSEEESRRRAREISEIESVLTGESGKFLLILGPCSAHEEKSVLEYLSGLCKLYEKVKDKFVIVPRVFTSKPRTKGVGYRGMISNPDCEGGEDYLRGLRLAREIHLRVLKETNFVAADEMLFPDEFDYIEDLVGYAVIGARTSESPLHRMAASGLSVPVGVKNPMSGSLPALAFSVKAIQKEQCFFRNGCQIRTGGNRFSHGILRGRVNEEGMDEPNYHKQNIVALLKEFRSTEIENPAVIIDCNHSNSGKRPELQPRIAEEVISLRREEKSFAKFVRGLMIESFLKSGSDSSGREYGKSVTDPCLGYKETEKLVYTLAEIL